MTPAPADNIQVNRIIDALGDDANVKRTLPGCMSALQSTVGECEAHLQAIESSFEHWLDIAQELSQVATESEQETINESHENQQDLHSQEVRKTFAENETQRREEAVQEAQRRMALAEEAFKQASKNIPSAWETLGISVVDGLSQSVCTIGSALVTALTPNKYVALGHTILGAVKAGLIGEKHNDTKQPNSYSAIDYPTNNDDPALIHLDNIQSYLSLLATITKNGTPSISQQAGAAPNDSPGTIRTFFLIVDQELPKDAAAGTFSYDAQKIIHDALDIITELNHATKAQKELSSTPTPLPRESWHRRVAALQTRTASLIARKDSMAGLAAGARAPRLQDYRTSSPHQSLVRAQLDRATAAFTSTTATLHAQRTAHDAAVARLHHNLSLITSIQRSISTLHASQLTLDAIIRILRASIAALAGLKAQITHLLRFFQGIAGMVEFAARGPCRDLLATLSSPATTTTPSSSHEIAGITYPAFQKQLLLNTTLMIRGYFGVVHEIARLYVRVSRDYIVPGVNLVDGLGLTQEDGGAEEGAMRRRTEGLEEYQRRAVCAIRKLAEEKQAALLRRAEVRVAGMKETGDDLLAPAADGDEDGAKEGREERRKVIEEAAEREVAAEGAHEEEWDFVDATARLLVSAKRLW